MAATWSGSASAEFPSFDHFHVAAPGAIFAARAASSAPAGWC